MGNLVETIIKHLQKYTFPVTVGEKEKWIEIQKQILTEYSVGFFNWSYGKYFRKYNNNKSVWFENKYNDLLDYELFDKPHFTGEELFIEYLERQNIGEGRDL